MEKNWLIRTSQNQILGPISKERVIELIKKGNLVDEDEICSGNGYWFQIKEKNLVEKYIYGNHLQTFNPITEARSIFTEEDMDEKLNQGVENISVSSGKENSYPDGGDLAFPDVKNSNNVEYSKVGNLPQKEDLDYPEIIDEKALDINRSTSQQKSKKTKKKKLKRKKIKKDFEEDEGPKRNDKYLVYIFLFLLVGLLCIFVFYKNTLNNLFPKVSLSSLFLSDAVAQVVDQKKKEIYFPLPSNMDH